jgi:alanyl-tRNA synthetase
MARANWSGSGQTAQAAEWLSIRDRLGPTIFEGYDAVDGVGEVLVIVRDGADVDSALNGEEVEVLFDRTPFYAESGGQVGDQGSAEGEGVAAAVVDTHKRAGDLHVHRIRVTGGELRVGQRLHLSVNSERRLRTRANHSAAHLLHAALKNVLGPHVAQKGQLVDAERVRFDISHGQPLTREQIDAVEAEVNAVVLQNTPTETKLMKPADAIAHGAVALFGEKYGEEVRVLTLGRSLVGDAPYSIELCGGTHVGRTGDIGLFAIVSEQGIAAGVRRVEGLTGEPARQWLMAQAQTARGLSEALKTPIPELPARIEVLQTERKQLERQLTEAKKQIALGGGGGQGAPAAEEIAGTKFEGRVLEGVSSKDLRGVVTDALKRLGSGVVAYAAANDGKAAIAVALTPDLTDRFDAAHLARVAVAAMGGAGAGGKAEFAQGGAPDGAKAADGVQAVRTELNANQYI